MRRVAWIFSFLFTTFFLFSSVSFSMTVDLTEDSLESSRTAFFVHDLIVGYEDTVIGTYDVDFVWCTWHDAPTAFTTPPAREAADSLSNALGWFGAFNVTDLSYPDEATDNFAIRVGNDPADSWVLQYDFSPDAWRLTQFSAFDPSTFHHFARFTPVPEPATVLLLGFGLVGLFGFRKKFKK